MSRQVIWIYSSNSEWVAEGEFTIFGGVKVKKINTRKQRCLW